MRFGMLGFAHVHAASYARCLTALPETDLVAIADPDQTRLQDAVSRFGGDAYLDSNDLLARDDVDAVVVMAETAHHRELIVAVAEAGKHVLCEKPIATSRVDGLAMVEACRSHGVRMGTVFPMRFNLPTIALRRAIQNGTIGTPLAAKATNPGQAPPGWFRDPALAGGGAVMDHVVHVADLLRWIFETEIVEVYAEVDTRFYPDLPVDDLGILMMRLANGMTASLDASWSRPKTWPTWGGLTLDVVGDRGVLATDAFAEQFRVVDDNERRHAYVSWGDDADLALLRGFVAAIDEGTDVPVTGEDGLRALEVALAAYESAKHGIPVTCPVTDEL